MTARAMAQVRAGRSGHRSHRHRAMQTTVMAARATGRSGRPVLSGPSTFGDGTAVGAGGAAVDVAPFDSDMGALRGPGRPEGEQTRCRVNARPEVPGREPPAPFAARRPRVSC